jgi:peptidyl-prolyl cis-trans isomerase B (cyclophilin B)
MGGLLPRAAYFIAFFSRTNLTRFQTFPNNKVKYRKIWSSDLMKTAGFFVLILFLALFTAATAGAQTAVPTPMPKPTPAPAGAPELKKANNRGAEKPLPAEPYDKADVKTMAGLCVSIDSEAGLIELEMFPETAPETVRNFLNLAATGAFDNTTFSRVVPGFVIQGGNLSTGDKWNAQTARRARRTIPDEPNAVLHDKGILSMARGDEANSATTDFFILLTSAPSLDGKFAAFGRVKRGMEVVEAINKMAVTGEKPDKPVKIRKASVSPCAPAP